MRNEGTNVGLTLLRASALEIPLASESVDCIVTSPPYYGLREYSGEQVCRWPAVWWTVMAGTDELETSAQECPYGGEDGILSYVAHTVAVCRGLRRVLKPTGTLWWNIGDCYNGSGGAGGDYGPGGIREGQPRYKGRLEGELKRKDLIFVPARVALALQADGWWLRSAVIWHKKSAMPEPGFDRPSSAHEFILMLTPRADYYYDWFGVSPGQNDNEGERIGKNLRSVWTMPTSDWSGEHFAVFPDELPGTAIRASTSRHGVCPDCGAPWERIIEREKADRDMEGQRKADAERTGRTDGRVMGPSGKVDKVFSVGWQATCIHADLVPVPATVLDPFTGSGTTGKVARQLGVNFVGLDLSAEYLDQQARIRVLGQTPKGALDSLPLFGGPLSGTAGPLPPDPE